MSETVSRITSHASRQERVLIVADACFEMFSIKELKRPVAILNEVALSFPEVTAAEISEAITLAISWHRALRRASGWMH